MLLSDKIKMVIDNPELMTTSLKWLRYFQPSNELEDLLKSLLVDLLEELCPFGVNVFSEASSHEMEAFLDSLFADLRHSSEEANRNVYKFLRDNYSITLAQFFATYQYVTKGERNFYPPTLNEDAQMEMGTKGKYEGPDMDFAEIMKRDIIDRSYCIRKEEVIGLNEAKDLLLTLVMPQEQVIGQSCKSVLVFGPPGTGKTLLAKAVATECGMTFLKVSFATLASKWPGESDRIVKCIFNLARAYALSTIFIDDLEFFCNAQGASDHEASRRMRSELLAEIDAVRKDGQNTILVLAATNFPWDVDEDLRDILDKRMYVPLPNFVNRKDLIRVNLETVEVAKDVEFEELSKRTAGYNRDELKKICQDASLNGFRRKKFGKTREEIKNMMAGDDLFKEPVSMRDFEEAITKVEKSVSAAEIDKYDKWFGEFGSD